MKTTFKIASLLCVLMLLVWSAPAQDVSSAQLHGVVRDPKGAVVTGAKVTVTDPQRGVERTATTDAGGEYQILKLAPGPYRVTVDAPGFAKWNSPNVVLTIGQAAELPVALSVATTTQEVTVSAEAELIETQRSSSTTTIGEQRIENLPINGRNYIQFAQTDSQIYRDTAPSIGAAPTSGLNFNGQRARANLVNVDGADTVDASVNGIRSTVSQEAVQEFQVITNGYNAEYGRASGGVVNIITKSGTNDFHGSAFGFLRNRNFQAQNPFTNVPDPAYTRVQYGLAMGGALKKDKTFWFFSFEGTRRHETGFSTIGEDCNGTVSCFGLVSDDVSSTFGAPAGSFVIQATPGQAATIAALGPGLTGATYAYLVGSSSAVALWGTMTGHTGAVGLDNTPFAIGGGAQFASSCNPSNTLCNGLPGQYVPLMLQRGNYPIFEGTTLYSARLDHHFTNNNTGMLRVNVSPSTQTGIQVNAQNQNLGQNAYSRTSNQTYRDFAVTAQDTWLLGNNKVNDFQFQYARRGLRYNFNTQSPFGSDVAVNIAGFAFTGREPFSYVDRVEQRYQFADKFSWVLGNHTVKFGVDAQYIPVDAAFTVNFGNVYNFSALSPSQFGFGACAACAGMSPVQAYGFGVPSTMVQGIGNPNASFNVKPVGFFLQDTWRMHSRFTLNYGVRYDVEFAPDFGSTNPLSDAAYAALGIQKGFRTDYTNIAPRLGFAWDPWGDGKTVVRGSYGMFYDNPLLGLLFLGSATDGVGTPQLILFGGAPCTNVPLSFSPLNLNATNVFQGILGTANCLPPGAATAMGYLPNAQQFDASDPNSTFINQNYLNPATFQPLLSQPFGFPEGRDFRHAYSQQASLAIERELGHDWTLSVGYNFAHGTHLNRPINANPVRGDLLMLNWLNDCNANGGLAGGACLAFIPSNPLFVTDCNPAAGIYPAALTSFFRPSGLNPSLAPVFGPGCTGAAAAYLNSVGLGLNQPNCTVLGAPVPQCNPFSDMTANYSNGSSVYHALTANLKKRFGNHWEMLASYTWSHTIDDSTDLQSLLSPQDSYFPYKERASSTFDQRHRLVISGIYQSGKVGSGFWGHVFSDWTVAPLIDVGSGRPFTILTAEPVNFQFSPNAARPNIVPAGTPTNSCGFPAQASPYSPTGFFQTPCFIDVIATMPFNEWLRGLDGNLGRNSANKPYTLFNDVRVSRRINLGERVKLDGIVDIFNVANKFNVADVSPLCSSSSCTAGTPTAAFDPRQIQFGLKLTW